MCIWGVCCEKGVKCIDGYLSPNYIFMLNMAF